MRLLASGFVHAQGCLCQATICTYCHDATRAACCAMLSRHGFRMITTKSVNYSNLGVNSKQLDMVALPPFVRIPWLPGPQGRRGFDGSLVILTGITAAFYLLVCYN